MQRAQDSGSCVMTLANAHHLGRIGHFAEMAVERGLVSLHFVNVQSRPVVAPWGGGDGRYGTNPFCAGIPLAGRPPFILDFATSRVAQGKMRVAHNEGRQVDPGYLIDEQGRPTTNPAWWWCRNRAACSARCWLSASTRATAWRSPASCWEARSPAAAPGTARPTTCGP